VKEIVWVYSADEYLNLFLFLFPLGAEIDNIGLS